MSAELFCALCQVVKEFHNIRKGAPLPTILTDKSAGKRQEDLRALYNEGETFSGILGKPLPDSNSMACAWVTPMASPHTLDMLDSSLVIETAASVWTNKNPSLPSADLAEIPLHLGIWWTTKEADGHLKETDLRMLAFLSDESRKPYINVISEQTRRVVDFFNRRGIKAKDLHNYMMFGYADEAERQTGLNRGPQSNPNGHSHVVFIDEARTNEKIVSGNPDLSSLMKIISGWDVLLSNRLGISVSRIIKGIVEARAGDLNPTVTFYPKYMMDPHGKRLNHFGFFQIGFGKEADYKIALAIGLDIIRKFEVFYQQLQQCYSNYYKNSGDGNKQEEVLEQVKRAARDFGLENEEAKKIIKVMLAFQPTYGQIISWLDELEREGRKDSLAYEGLQVLKRAYIKRRDKLADPLTREHYKQLLIRRYGYQIDEAEAALKYIDDTYKDSWESWPTIVSTLAAHFSGYLHFEGLKQGNESLTVSALNLVPRMGSQAGFIETHQGRIIQRQTGR